MRTRPTALTAVLACVLAFSGCASEPDTSKTVDITAKWKRHFSADDQPKDWRSHGKTTERVTLDDDFLNIDGDIADCEDARIYWQMGRDWAKKVDAKVSDYITVYSDGELAGDTTTTGEFDCHL